MCQKCLDSVKEHFPDLSEDEAGDLLMEFTAFPFGSHEYVDGQLAALAAARAPAP